MVRGIVLRFWIQALACCGMMSCHSVYAQDSPMPAKAAEVTLARESRESLLADRTSLIAQAPIVVEHDETADYVRDYVRVQWRSGDPIDLYIYSPPQVKNPPVVLYLYSYPADGNKFLSTSWGKRAVSRGYAAVGFVSALTGARYHSRPMKQWFVSELQESLSVSVHDVQLILDYLASRGDLDMGRVGIFGEGSGGTIAALAASVDPRIQVADLLNPWGDWPDWLSQSALVPAEERATYLTPQFLAKVKDFDPVKWLGKFPQKNLRLEQVLSDPVTPPLAKDKLAAAVAPEQVVRYKDVAAHELAWRATGTAGWIEARLAGFQPPEQGQPTATGREAKPK
jgi:acetyl esterase/lipase